jgi:acyl-CoA dehydrogenase
LLIFKPIIYVLQVHIQQVGMAELKRAPRLRRATVELKNKEKKLLERHGLKARL